MPASRTYSFIIFNIITFLSIPAWSDQKNLFTWFRGGESTVINTRSNKSIEFYPFGYDDNQCSTLPLPLAQFIFSKFGTGDPTYHFPREDLFKCYGKLEPDHYRYRLELTDEGIRFLLPLTPNGSCGEEIRATFKELAPYMNKQGLNYVSLLKKSN